MMANYSIQTEGASTDPLSIYLRIDNQLIHFARFHAYPPREMFFEVAGLTGADGVVSAEYPELRAVLSPPAPYRSRQLWRDRQEVSIPMEHISFHSSGRCHLKPRGSSRKRIIAQGSEAPISKETPRFLELHLMSDAGKHYTPPREGVLLEPPNVVIDCDRESGIDLHLAFSGSHYPLEQFAPGMSGESFRAPLTITTPLRLNGALIKGIGFPLRQPTRPPEAPHGTIVRMDLLRSEVDLVEKCYVVT